MINLPARRIGLRWRATRAPRQGDDGGAEHFTLPFFYPAPLDSPKALNSGGLGAEPPNRSPVI